MRAVVVAARDAAQRLPGRGRAILRTFHGRCATTARTCLGHCPASPRALLGHCRTPPGNCAADSSDAARQLRRNGLGHFPAAAGTLLGNGPDTARRLLGKCSGTAAGQSAVATALFDKGMVSSLCRRRMKARRPREIHLRRMFDGCFISWRSRVRSCA